MKIVLTGGGTSGHVTPNIALLDVLKNHFEDIYYIGTEKGVEKALIEGEGIPFFTIEAGKLRRYIDVENLKDISKIFKGYKKSVKILKKLKPDVVFSKGGFVSCPVVWAARKLKIPVVLHESDITPGLANKLSLPSASKICYAFPETEKHLPEGKRVYTGLPVRKEILEGDREKGIEICGFENDKPVLTVIGGSLGSVFLNDTVRMNLNELLKHFNICHLCGKGHIDHSLLNVNGYCQFEYVNKELCHIMAATDMLVSRAGATAIFEIVELKKPALLIPLSKKASRGDQIDNAKSFAKQGLVEFTEEEDLNPSQFTEKILSIYMNRDKYIKIQSEKASKDSRNAVLEVILSVVSNAEKD